MAVSYKTSGFVFRKEDRQEADRIFTVFTQDFGKVDIFAKSIRACASKLKGGIEIFSVSDLEFIQGKNRKTLTDALFVKKFNNILESPEKIAIAYKISNTLDTFVKGPQIDERIWALVLDIFGKLNDQKTNNKFLYYYFFWNFIGILGHSPELSVCIHCRQSLHPENLYFSNQEGGIICKNCGILKKPFGLGHSSKLSQSPQGGDGIKIMPDTVKVLRLIIKKEWDVLMCLKIGLQAKKMLKEISDSYYKYLVSMYSFKL